MICASVPSLKPLFTKIMPRLLGSSAAGGTGSKLSGGKLSRYGLGYGGRSRSVGTGSVPLQSFDNAAAIGISTKQDRDLEIGSGGDSGSDTDRIRVNGGGGRGGDESKMGITVHQTFEMRTVENSDVIMDDGSEKDLVTKPWSAAGTNASRSGGGGVAAGSVRNYSRGGGVGGSQNVNGNNGGNGSSSWLNVGPA